MNLSRSALVLCSLILVLTVPAWAKPKPEPKEVEYHRSDMNFYWKGDVLKVDSTAVILPLAELTQKGDSYFLTPKKHAPKHIYVEVLNDWIEPITPPNPTAPLAIAPDAMQIREPQGDVQVALPSAPATYVPATDSMVIPNGAVIKTGSDGTAAVLFGGFNSARFIPNSEAAVQQTVEPQLRTTEVDLTKGAVFSKVGEIVGVKQDYKVHTPLGVAAARGTDFVSIALPKRTDVWIAQGTVQLDQVNGKPVGSVQSDGGGLKIIRYPPMSDPHASMMASSETMTAAMDIIPIINLKVRGLHERMAKGETMTPSETDYMARIKKVPCLIKLVLTEPPPAPKVIPAPDIAPVPPPAPAAIPSAADATVAPATPSASANTPGAAPASDAAPLPPPATAPSTAPTPDITTPPAPMTAPSAAATDAAPSSPPVAAPSAPPETEMPATKANAMMTPRVEESTAPTNASPSAPHATLP